MTIDLQSLNNAKRLLFNIPLEPVQGSRFQPTRFPSLGAAEFQTKSGTSLLVESTQSMANHLEMTIWDASKKDVREHLEGLSHVRITRGGEFLTDTILESHRLSSPYLLESKNKSFLNTLQEEMGAMKTGPVDRRKLAKTLLKYDINSLLHGIFLAKTKLAGGRLRVARALSAFIEADSVHVASSGGVKNDHVDPSGETKVGFGNVPFARDEYTADSITLYVNLDLAQIRGYGLGDSVEHLLILLSLYKLRTLISEGMRLRTSCDLQVKNEPISAEIPKQWLLPSLDDLTESLKSSICQCKDQMLVTCESFEDEFKKAKKDKGNDSEKTEDDE